MAGRDDDLTDLASDLAQDPELADTFAKLAESPPERAPHSGSEFKNPLAGFIDRERITPRIPAPTSSAPGFAAQPPSSSSGLIATPSSRRTVGGAPLRGVRAFAMQSSLAQPARSASPPAHPPEHAAHPTTQPPQLLLVPDSSPISATLNSSDAATVPGIERIYPDRDTPTVRFMKSGSPDSMPTPLSSDLEDLEASVLAAEADEARGDSPTLPGAPPKSPSPDTAPTSEPTSDQENGLFLESLPSLADELEPSAAEAEADAGRAEPETEPSPSPAAQEHADPHSPRIWLLAVATVLTAVFTLVLLIVLVPLQRPKSDSPAAPAATQKPTAQATVAPLPSPDAPPAISAAPIEPAAPAPSQSASADAAPAPTTDPSIALTTDPAIAQVGVPAPTFRPATPLTGRLPQRSVPSAASASPQPSAKPTAKPTAKPITGPIFELDN